MINYFCLANLIDRYDLAISFFSKLSLLQRQVLSFVRIVIRRDIMVKSLFNYFCKRMERIIAFLSSTRNQNNVALGLLAPVRGAREILCIFNLVLIPIIIQLSLHSFVLVKMYKEHFISRLDWRNTRLPVYFKGKGYLLTSFHLTLFLSTRCQQAFTCRADIELVHISDDIITSGCIFRSSKNASRVN